MPKEKRIKKAVVKLRVTDEKKESLLIYAKKNNTTITKIIDSYLTELLKDVKGKS